MIDIADSTFISDRIGDFIRDMEDKGLAKPSKPINQRELGDYVLLETIGVAGQAIVYKAQQKGSGQLSAIKVPRNSTIDDQKNWDRFVRGTLIAYRLTNNAVNSKVVKVAEVRLSKDEPEPFFVMEYLDGYDLKLIIDFVKSHQIRIPVDIAIFIAIEVCKALKQIHEYLDPEYGGPVIHRDVKPSNIMISRSGEVKLMDLQIAKGDAEGDAPTTQAFIAFLPYSPPEMINPAEFGKAEPSSDIYSATVILYELLCNRLPFGNDGYTGAKIAAGTYQKPSDISKKPLPKGIEDIISAGMHKDKDKRYQSASQMLRDLMRIYEVIEYGGFKYLALSAFISRIMDKKRKLLIVITAVFLVALTALAAFSFRPNRPLGVWSDTLGFKAILDSKMELQTMGQTLIFKEVSQGHHTLSVEPLEARATRQNRSVYVDKNGAGANFYFGRRSQK